jgi:hypothetical protein
MKPEILSCEFSIEWQLAQAVRLDGTGNVVKPEIVNCEFSIERQLAQAVRLDGTGNALTIHNSQLAIDSDV